MKKENIGFDLDGVICDTYGESFKVLKEMYPKNVLSDNFSTVWEKDFNLTQKQITDCFIECSKRGMYKEFPPYKDALYPLKKISRYYRIFIVTWRNFLPNAVADTLYWLDRNKIPYYRLVMTKNKFKLAERENFKFFVDDNPEFCNRTAKTIVPTFLFRQPWNKDAQLDPLVKIVKSWKEIEKLLLF